MGVSPAKAIVRLNPRLESFLTTWRNDVPPSTKTPTKDFVFTEVAQFCKVRAQIRIPAPSFPGEQVRVLIVDDQEFIRRGIRAALSVAPEITVFGEASDGSEAIENSARAESRRSTDGYQHARVRWTRWHASAASHAAQRAGGYGQPVRHTGNDERGTGIRRAEARFEIAHLGQLSGNSAKLAVESALRLSS